MGRAWRAERQAEFDQYKQQLVDEAEADLKKRIGEYLVGYYELNITKEESIRGLVSKSKLKETAMTPLAAGLDRIGREKAFRHHPVMRPWAELIGVADEKFPAALKKTLKADRPLHPALRQRLEKSPPAGRLELLSAYGELFDAAWNEPARAEPPAAWREFWQAPQSPFQLKTEAVVRASRLLGAGRKKLADFENAILDLEVNHPGLETQRQKASWRCGVPVAIQIRQTWRERDRRQRTVSEGRRMC